MKSYDDMNNYEDESVDIHQVENTPQKQSDAQSKKYRLSLLYLLKDLLFLVLKGGIIGAVILNILMYLVFKEPFKPIGCLAYIICGAVLGIIIGYVIKSFRSESYADSYDETTGIEMYNMFARTNNIFAGIFGLGLFSGGTAGSGLAIIGFALIIIVRLIRLIYLLILMPISIVYLCIMSIIEMIVHGIPKGLGDFLDKLIPMTAVVGSIAMFILMASKIG